MVVNNEQVLSQELQLTVLGYVARDKVVMSKFSGVLQERHFDNPIHRLIFRIVQHHFSEYKRVPSQRTLQSELQRLLDSEKSYVPDQYFWAEVTKVYSVSLEEREYVVDSVYDFLLRRELLELSRVAQTEAVSIERVSTSVVTQQFRKIATMMAGGEDAGDFLLRDIDQLSFRSSSEGKISTGFRKLDEALGGGLGGKELGIVLAPTGRGKSAVLIQIGCNVLRIGKKPLHVTFELGKERVKARYVSSLSKVAKDELFDRQDEVRRKMKRIRRVVGNADLVVKEWPSRSCTVDMLRGFIYTLRLREGFDPDVIIVDYADLMRPEVAYARAETRHQLGSIYETLRGLAMELDKPIWTASQTNRSGLSKPIITVLDIAESFEKAMVADVVLAICRTTRERRINEGRFFLAKNRDNISEVTIPFKEDLASNRFWEIQGGTIPQEEFERMQQRWEEGEVDV